MWRKIQIVGAVFLALVFWLFSMILAGGGLYTVAGTGTNPIKINRLTGRVWVYTMTVTNDLQVVSLWVPAVDRRPGKLTSPPPLRREDFVPLGPRIPGEPSSK